MLDTNILESKIRARLILDNDEKDENSDEFRLLLFYKYEAEKDKEKEGHGKRRAQDVLIFFIIVKNEPCFYFAFKNIGIQHDGFLCPITKTSEDSLIMFSSA